jgi:transposase
MVMDAIDSDRFVFVDECSSNTSLAPLYGWSPKGERPYQKAPRNWGKNITLISSIGKEGGVGASLVVEGSTTGTVFETYLQEVLYPTLKRGQVVVMDNLSSHNLPAPPYSPDYIPTEQAFSKLKSHLRAACARSQQMLVEIIGRYNRKLWIENL